VEFPSSTGHVKSRVNQRGPPRKAKYYPATDSEPVPWGKGEKHPGEGSEIEPETVDLQAVGGSLRGPDGLPFEEWAGELAVRGEVKAWAVAAAKASLNRASSRVL